jgi:hypothetical protein
MQKCKHETIVEQQACKNLREATQALQVDAKKRSNEVEQLELGLKECDTT